MTFTRVVEKKSANDIVSAGMCTSIAALVVLASAADITELWHDVYLDHWNLSSNTTMRLRYLVDEQHFVANASAPQTIVLYCGNEGSITDFAANSGFLWTMAQRWSAPVVLIEERFFGASVPDAAFRARDYLSSAAVLEDNVQVIVEALRPRFGHDARIVAVGGSYGGMLAAWLRRQHPSLVFAAYASSAPLLGFAAAGAPRPGGAIPEEFWRTVERSFLAGGGATCAASVRGAFDELWELRSANTPSLAALASTFALCGALAPLAPSGARPAAPARSVVDLVGYLQNWLQEIAVLNYPSGANFTGLRIPPHPVALTCARVAAGEFSLGYLPWHFVAHPPHNLTRSP